MSYRKRCTTLFLAVILIFVILSVAAQAASLYEGDNKFSGLVTTGNTMFAKGDTAGAFPGAAAKGKNLHPGKARLGAHAKAAGDALDTWVWRNPLPQGNKLNGITYGKSTFVAVGDCGAVVTSPNGTAWTSRTSGNNGPLYGVSFANGMFVAVGYDITASAGAILTSSNGTTWTSQTSGTTAGLYGVAYATVSGKGGKGGHGGHLRRCGVR